MDMVDQFSKILMTQALLLTGGNESLTKLLAVKADAAGQDREIQD